MPLRRTKRRHPSPRTALEAHMKIIGQNNLMLPQFDKAVAKYPAARRALCFGDSWFQYVPHPTDLNKQIAKLFKQTLFLREGVAGRDSAMWKAALPRIQREIGTYQFDAILLSTGGNDIVGEELKEFVKEASFPQSPGDFPWGEIPGPVFDHILLDTFGHALRDQGHQVGDPVPRPLLAQLHHLRPHLRLHLAQRHRLQAGSDQDEALGQAVPRRRRTDQPGRTTRRHELARGPVRPRASRARLPDRQHDPDRLARRAEDPTAMGKRNPPQGGGIRIHRQKVLEAGAVDRAQVRRPSPRTRSLPPHRGGRCPKGGWGPHAPTEPTESGRKNTPNTKTVTAIHEAKTTTP